MAPFINVSTGISGLDEILNHLQMGDNVVFQVDDIDDYKKFVEPYAQAALATNHRLVYMRFANHPHLLETNKQIKIYKLNAIRDSNFSLRRCIISSETKDKTCFMYLIVYLIC